MALEERHFRFGQGGLRRASAFNSLREDNPQIGSLARDRGEIIIWEAGMPDPEEASTICS